MKKVMEFLKELKKKPYGKSVFFFGFYLIFFIIIFVVLTIAGNRNISKSTENKSLVNITFLSRNRYSFNYEINIDNNTNTYSINKDKNEYKYKYNEKDYYQENLETFVKDEDWIHTDSPIKFNKLIEAKYINTIINDSYMESKTTYDNGDITYNLLVSSNTLNKILDGKDTDIDEKPNRITISMDKRNGVNDIKYNLDSYCKVNNICTNNMTIFVKYGEYNNVN